MEIGLLEIEFNLVLIILLINAIKPETGKKNQNKKSTREWQQALGMTRKKLFRLQGDSSVSAVLARQSVIN